MRKVGKFEKVPQKAPEKAPQKETKKGMQKNVLLQTYFTSLLSLVLCVTMFFGTTAAWFTDTVQAPQNELLAGTMKVALKHASAEGGNLGTFAEVTETYKILDANTKWEPGYTAIERFQVIENGDLAFTYEMLVDFDFNREGVTDGVKAKEAAVAKAITVYTYFGTDTDKLPESYDAMCVSPDWEPIGTLHDVITKKLPVFSGKMDENMVSGVAAGKTTHMIALHMDEAYGNDEDDVDIQGTSLDGITITLVAHQMPSESDAFGDVYDRQAVNYSAVRDVEVEAGKLVNELTITMVDYRTAVPSIVTKAAPDTLMTKGNVKLTVAQTDNATIGEVEPDLTLAMAMDGLDASNTVPVNIKLQLADKPASITAVYLNSTKLAVEAYTYDAISGELTLNVAALGTVAIVY